MNKQPSFVHYAKKHLGWSSMHMEQYIRQSTPSAYWLNNFTPSVIEERHLNVTQMDVFSRLMMDRIIFLGVGIDDYVANVIQAQLLFLDSISPTQPIQMYINSPGGSVTAGLGIYDTMHHVSPTVSTICTSLAASMGAVLLSSGEKGQRVCLPHSRVMIHQPAGGMQGQVSDMTITYDFFISLQKELYTILSENTGKPFEQIKADCDRDNWMSPTQAVEYGLVDEVIGKKQK